MSIKKIQKEFEEIAKQRDWNSFHSPKNLSISISVETSERLEEFHWMTEEDSRDVPVGSERYLAIKEELGDVFVNTLRLVGMLGVDLIGAAEKKLQNIREKYPVETSKGNAVKRHRDRTE